MRKYLETCPACILTSLRLVRAHNEKNDRKSKTTELVEFVQHGKKIDFHSFADRVAHAALGSHFATTYDAETKTHTISSDLAPFMGEITVTEIGENMISVKVNSNTKNPGSIFKSDP